MVNIPCQAGCLNRRTRHQFLNFPSARENLGHLHPNSTSDQLPPRVPRRNFVHEAWKLSLKCFLGVGALAPTFNSRKSWALAPKEALLLLSELFMRQLLIMEATPMQMRLHATRKNLAPSAPDHEPSTCALDSSRSLPFIAPLRLRWSPVVFQRKMPSISFPFLLLRDSFFHHEGGTPTPHIESRSPKRRRFLFPVQPLTSNIQSLSPLLATHPRFAPRKFFPCHTSENTGLKVLCLPHIQKMAGVGGVLLLTRFPMRQSVLSESALADKSKARFLPPRRDPRRFRRRESLSVPSSIQLDHRRGNAEAVWLRLQQKKFLTEAERRLSAN
jgi:hypothetical protein